MIYSYLLLCWRLLLHPPSAHLLPPLILHFTLLPDLVFIHYESSVCKGHCGIYITNWNGNCLGGKFCLKCLMKWTRTSTNVYNRCDWLPWQFDCYDSLTSVMTAMTTWQLDCLDSLTALKAGHLESLAALTAWLPWQLGCHDSLAAMTAWLPWQLDCLYSLDSLTALTA